MNWPWRSAARERENNLRLQIKHLEGQLIAARGYETYWRDRYERIADLTLVRQVNPNAVSAVHVDPPANDIATLGARVGKVAGVMGSARGIKFETLHNAKAAENPSH